MSDQNGQPRRPNTINPETLVLTGRAVSLISLIVGVAVTSGWLAIEAFTYINEARGERAAMASRLDRLERQMGERAASRWTYRNMRRYCREAEIVNLGTGWECPDLEAIKDE